MKYDGDMNYASRLLLKKKLKMKLYSFHQSFGEIIHLSYMERIRIFFGYPAFCPIRFKWEKHVLARRRFIFLCPPYSSSYFFLLNSINIIKFHMAINKPFWYISMEIITILEWSRYAMKGGGGRNAEWGGEKEWQKNRKRKRGRGS